MESVRQFAGGEQKIKEFVHELQTFTEMIGCTSILMSFRDPTYSFTENAVVDGVVELSDDLVGPWAVRELTVLKFRGGDYLRGKHEVEITEAGIVIHPRTEIQFDKPPQQATEQRIRMGFGVTELDKMLWAASRPARPRRCSAPRDRARRCSACRSWWKGRGRGRRALLSASIEPPPRLLEKAQQVGIPLEEYVKSGHIELIWQPPLEHMLDSLAEQLLEKIREDEHFRRRLFIDGIEGFRAASVYADRMPRFLSALCNQLRTYDVTALISEELALFRPEIDMPNPELANVVETVDSPALCRTASRNSTGSSRL